MAGERRKFPPLSMFLFYVQIKNTTLVILLCLMLASNIVY